ncbi:DUF4102 domain-containing protein [Paracoccus sp. IB05]|uniref:tyrosine-type recombinase/integrase n=1 Tax=Paracoccus sp. IB05 TaxID=2779367 RepID=UPI0018E82D35|nr:DUF4102 domain-containing protein [Paracoccus sp. IB05]MBJ2149416.1 hypothetical protein [Paracoccus sp. IB05]
MGMAYNLRVDPSGGKVWVQRIVINGKRCELGMGRVDFVTLADARLAAFGNRKLACEGGDPLGARLGARRSAQEVLTFEEAARKVHEINLPTWKSPKHGDQFLNTLATYAFPIIGNTRAPDVTTADVLAVLQPIWLEKAETVRRVKQRIGTVMKWCIAKGWRKDNPVDAVDKGVAPTATTIVLPDQGANGNGIYGGHRGVTVRLQGIVREFQNLQMDRVAWYDLDGISNHAAPFDALPPDYAEGVDRFCTVTAAGNDTWNGHGLGSVDDRTDGYPNISCRNLSIAPYSAWAWDDNRSFHESSNGRVDGGLCEFGGSTGSAPAQGAEETCSGTVMRHNGWRGLLPEGDPAYVADAANLALLNTEGDDGNGCSVRCLGVVVGGGAAWIWHMDRSQASTLAAKHRNPRLRRCAVRLIRPGHLSRQPPG